MAVQQFNSFASDTQKFDFFKKTSTQQFARTDVLVHQSIDPTARMLEAGKILAAGGSLFMEEQHRSKK
ncbi:hypothetical protein [Methylomonas methanica]|uniref:Uncharacterized protein n=1 Tax=Methylomonas methanica (strain DSM 25384 / MC09) TaxID=857087 RepID=G0A7J5_METMM|nr:hypothetical protein [Methylomonas methanica]AEG00665.1 hypothetical protein Metme_2261 [Methylomonas methanica MC09]